jgi:hypothetical protein
LEELIKQWKTVHGLTKYINKAITKGEQAKCHLIHPEAVAVEDA